MRFNTPEEVKAAAEKHAVELYERHIKFGVDLNPYSTEGARDEFDRAFNGHARYGFEGDGNFDYRWQVGCALARLVASKAEK